MGITSSLITALSGLSTSQSEIDVVGNNIANVNTTGFKSSSIDFKTQFLQNFSFGSAPNGDLGGSNPMQVGLGVSAGAISTDFSTGSLQATGVQTNLAIQGDGFFIVNQGGQQVYTRDGSFQLNDQDQLVSSDGDLVQGYGVDANFNLVPGALTNLTIPLGTAAVAQATTSATFTGNLDSNGTLPSSVSNTTSQALFLSSGTGPPAGTDLLTNLSASAGGTPLFNAGDVITFNAKVGPVNSGTSITPQTFDVTANSTLSDFQSFLTGSLGINTSNNTNGNLTAPGATLIADPNPANTNAVDLDIVGNLGSENNINLSDDSISINSGGTTTTPFTWTNQSTADGESTTFTNMTVYDSLGTPIPVNVTASLISKSSTGTTWQFNATTPDNAGTGATTQTLVGSGTISFDNNGNLLSTTTPTLSIDRSNTGANPVLNVALDFSSLTGLGIPSNITGTANGSAAGTLTKYSIQQDGIIQGSFSNGVTRPIGQVVLATFQNDQGLVANGGNTFSTGPNSGTAVLTVPGTGTAGAIASGSLEQSNVDLSAEFVNLISASTAFSASSRVITTGEQLLQALLSAAQG
jgi:flagellar hook protein FlgE